MNHLGTVTLETERLILRRFAMSDAEDAFRNWEASEAVTRYMTWPPYQSIGDLKGYIQYCIDGYKNADCYNWVIEYKENRQAIGSIGVVELREDVACAEVGYCLGEAYWGRGIMPEALRCIIAFLFDEVGVNRIQATHDARNPSSGRVMEKCGLRYEGTLRQYGRNNQGVCDAVMRSILREEYKLHRELPVA